MSPRAPGGDDSDTIRDRLNDSRDTSTNTSDTSSSSSGDSSSTPGPDASIPDTSVLEERKQADREAGSTSQSGGSNSPDVRPGISSIEDARSGTASGGSSTGGEQSSTDRGVAFDGVDDPVIGRRTQTSGKATTNTKPSEPNDEASRVEDMDPAPSGVDDPVANRRTGTSGNTTTSTQPSEPTEEPSRVEDMEPAPSSVDDPVADRRTQTSGKASSSSQSGETGGEPSSVDDLQGTGPGASPSMPEDEADQSDSDASDTGGGRQELPERAPDGRRIPDGDQSDGDSASGEVQGVFVSNQGLEERDDELGDRARQVEQQALEETEFLDDSDEVRVAEDGSVELTTEGRKAQKQFRREQITEDVLERNPGLTRDEVSVDLGAPGGPDVDVTERGQAEAAGLVAAPRQGGLFQIQQGSVRDRVAGRAGSGVQADEVDTTVSDGMISVDVEPTGGVTTIAGRQGGRRDIQERSLEQQEADRRGNATSRDEVDVQLVDGDPRTRVYEPVPATARVGGGRRELQQEQIAQRFASQNEDVEANDLLVNVTGSGASVQLNDAARAERIREEVASERDYVDEDEVNVSFDGSGEAQVTLEESARREALRERAERQNPNARDITIVENEQGELVARVREESDIDRTIRYGDNFVRDPVGSVLEGGSDIVTGSVDATQEFVEGRARGIRNPGQTLDWAYSGAADTVTGAGESAVSFGEGLYEGATNPRRTLEDTVDAVEDQPGGGVIAASLPVAAAEPTPFGEIGVGTAAAVALGAGAAYGAGQEISRRDIEELDEEQAEIGAPERSGRVEQREIVVDEETGLVQQEIAVEDVPEDENEIDIPQNMERSEVDVNPDDGTVRVPIELTNAFLEEQREEQDDEERLEELLANEEQLSEREREELNELARQAQEQQLYEQEQRYGKIERESVPEFRDEPISDNSSQEDIGDGIAGEASERTVAEDELIGSSIDGIERDETLPVQENFEQYMERQRRRLERAQRSRVLEEEDASTIEETVPAWLERSREQRARARATALMGAEELVAGELARRRAAQRPSVTVPARREQANDATLQPVPQRPGTEERTSPGEREGQQQRPEVDQVSFPAFRPAPIQYQSQTSRARLQGELEDGSIYLELPRRRIIRRRVPREPPYGPGEPPGPPTRPDLERNGNGVGSGFGGGAGIGSTPESGDDRLFAGWYAETLEAIATRSAGSRGAPSQSVLEEEASTLGPAAQLPTAAFDDEETSERIEDTQRLFSGSGSLF